MAVVVAPGEIVSEVAVVSVIAVVAEVPVVAVVSVITVVAVVSVIPVVTSQGGEQSVEDRHGIPPVICLRRMRNLHR
ncbi:hypothetical protein ACFW1F_11660 [Streptomyces bungoensis]|uniref:hypothetical protein n=1 Tax=Streptomyces bungoensis TaxID=285568 RepID=UPI003448169B